MSSISNSLLCYTPTDSQPDPKCIDIQPPSTSSNFWPISNSEETSSLSHAQLSDSPNEIVSRENQNTSPLLESKEELEYTGLIDLKIKQFTNFFNSYTKEDVSNWQHFFETSSYKLRDPENLIAFLNKFSEIWDKHFSSSSEESIVIKDRLIEFSCFLEYFFSEQIYLLSLKLAADSSQKNYSSYEEYRSFFGNPNLYNRFPSAVCCQLTNFRIQSLTQFSFVWGLFLKQRDILSHSITDLGFATAALERIKKIRLISQNMVDMQNQMISCLENIIKTIESNPN